MTQKDVAQVRAQDEARGQLILHGAPGEEHSYQSMGPPSYGSHPGHPKAPQLQAQAQSRDRSTLLTPSPPQGSMRNNASFGGNSGNAFDDIGLNFGDGDEALEKFDFDSFLHAREDNGGSGDVIRTEDSTFYSGSEDELSPNHVPQQQDSAKQTDRPVSEHYALNAGAFPSYTISADDTLSNKARVRTMFIALQSQSLPQFIAPRNWEM